MKSLIFFIIILIIVIVFLIIVLLKVRREEGENNNQVNLDKIISMFETDNELTNAEIRNELGVSSRTVVRYMDELEAQGKVIQTGSTGNAVTYRLN